MFHKPKLSLKLRYFVILFILQVSKCSITQPCRIHIEYSSENIPQQAKKLIAQSAHLIGEVIDVKYEFNYSRFYFKGKDRCSQSVRNKDRNTNEKRDLCRIINISGISSDIENNSTSLEEINFIVYVISEPSFKCHSSFAYASSCRYDQSYIGGVRLCRPIIGAINICPQQLATYNTLDLKRSIIHEMIHLLGFSYSSIIEFLSCDSFQFNLLCFKRKNILSTSANDYLSIQSFDLIEKAINLTANFHTQTIFDLNDNCNIQYEKNLNDLLVKFCQSNCMFKTNIRIKNTSYDFEHGIPVSSSKSGIHWASNLFVDTASIMDSGNWPSGSIVILDPLTLTLLEDSGWYHINYDKVEMLNCFINDISRRIEKVLKVPNEKNLSYHKKHDKYVEPVHDLSLNVNQTHLRNLKTGQTSSGNISSSAALLFIQVIYTTSATIILNVYLR